MSGAKAKRPRRGLALQHVTSRPLRDVSTASAVSRLIALADGAVVIATACSAAAVGFEVCARRTRDPRIAVAAESAARFLRVLLDATIAAAVLHGVDARPRARTCDRLRWEWLASTAVVVDGASDGRLLVECARILAAIEPGHFLHALDLRGNIAARLRVASAEAYSLAAAAQLMRRGELAPALTFT